MSWPTLGHLMAMIYRDRVRHWHSRNADTLKCLSWTNFEGVS